MGAMANPFFLMDGLVWEKILDQTNFGKLRRVRKEKGGGTKMNSFFPQVEEKNNERFPYGSNGCLFW